MFGDADPMDRSVRTYSEQLHGAILHSAGLQGSPVANDTHNRCPIVAKALYTWNGPSSSGREWPGMGLVVSSPLSDGVDVDAFGGAVRPLDSV